MQANSLSAANGGRFDLTTFVSGVILFGFMMTASDIAFGADVVTAPLPGLAVTASDRGDGGNKQLRDQELGALAPAAGNSTPANDTDQAKRFILALGNAAISTISNGALSRPEREAGLRRLLVEGFDLDMLSRLVLGRYWRVATAAERAEYRELFESFMLSSYINRLSTYSGESLNVLGAVRGKRRVIVVRSEIVSPKKPTMRVDWLVHVTDGRFRVIDVAVEGISMAITQRSEFASIIKSSGGRVSGLIVALRQKIT